MTETSQKQPAKNKRTEGAGDYIIPIAVVRRIIRKASPGNVGYKAVIELGAILEDIGKHLATNAYQLTEHRGRMTIR